MNKNIIIILAIIIVVAVFALPLSLMDADNKFAITFSFNEDLPKTYAEPWTKNFEFVIYNDEPISGAFAIVGRMVDTDSDTIPKWEYLYGIAGGGWDRYQHATYGDLDLTVPGYNGLGEPYNGEIQIGYVQGVSHYTQDMDVQTTIKYSFTINYGPSNTKPSVGGQPIGPSTGEIGEALSYLAGGSDVDGDNIKFLFDWDDTSNSGWGRNTRSHTWNNPGTYHIKYKVKDEHGEESSSWSSTKTVTIEDSNGGGTNPDEINVFVMVKDIYQNPVEGATVVIGKGPDGGEAVTDNNGKATFTISSDDKTGWDVYVEKTGYLPSDLKSQSFNSNNYIQVELIPEGNNGNLGIPGFDLIVFIGAITIAFILIRRKNR